MPTQEELIGLLMTPSESLSIEYKSWLDLSITANKAILAKAAIALVNEGGGIIVLGMGEDGEGGALNSLPRPASLTRYNLDEINASICRYAEPTFHCGLMFAQHATTNHEHAFIIVPGGTTVPVMSARGSDGTIAVNKCYIRKPGPKSEEPHTAEEWRKLLNRCLRDGRENMLDAIRVIVHGGPTAPAAPAAEAPLTIFCNRARDRWQELIRDLPADDVARMPHGHYEIECSFSNVQPTRNLEELRQRLQTGHSVQYTGWAPFIMMTRPEFSPAPVDNGIEAWLGNPNAERFGRNPDGCDFWRVSPAGMFFLLRGYYEDSLDNYNAGEIFDADLPVLRVGEAVLFIARVARQFEPEDINILIRCKYSGLRGRQLGSVDAARRHFSASRVSSDDAVELEITAKTSEIEDNLVEVLHRLLTPLYERFGFFQLSQDLVRQELGRLRQRNY